MNNTEKERVGTTCADSYIDVVPYRIATEKQLGRFTNRFCKRCEREGNCRVFENILSMVYHGWPCVQEVIRDKGLLHTERCTAFYPKLSRRERRRQKEAMMFVSTVKDILKRPKEE